MSEPSGRFIISAFGEPDVLQWQALPELAPQAGEVAIRHEAIGVNYIDIYHRKGIYGRPLALPSGLGVEGAGVVTAVGADVTNFAVGDRVAYVGGAPGAYGTARCIAAARVVPVPDGVSSQTAAAVIFKGLTVEYLIRRCRRIGVDDIVLWHAAAGGVGSLAVQWLAHVGASVIGTVGSDDKAKRARRLGCTWTINYSNEPVLERVLEITSGRGVDVVYDSVGQSTIADSIRALRPRGTLVSFGESSGPVAPIAPATLGAQGSVYFVRPSIAHYTADRTELLAAARDVFGMVERGSISVDAPTVYPLREAAQAQRDLESRKTQGSVILVPEGSG